MYEKFIGYVGEPSSKRQARRPHKEKATRFLKGQIKNKRKLKILWLQEAMLK